MAVCSQVLLLQPGIEPVGRPRKLNLSKSHIPMTYLRSRSGWDTKRKKGHCRPVGVGKPRSTYKLAMFEK